jgi:hypothetical protein
VSLGGYYAPRAAAFDKRIQACVALSGAYERKPTFEGRPIINVEAFRARSHSANLEEASRRRSRGRACCPSSKAATTSSTISGIAIAIRPRTGWQSSCGERVNE